MSWIYLFIASIFEVGWPIGLKLAEISPYKISWISFAVIMMALSGFFLYFAQKTIPLGTAYAVWTGIGTGCTFIFGVLFFQDTFSVLRLAAVCFIICGVILLKYGH